ncbi:MAG: hypothetical protein IT252_11705 [Chitinophagaceae bacterium]|nr:hypothetical protein [Chitinophagaceae bacterium]
MQRVVVILLFLQAAAWFTGKKPTLVTKGAEGKRGTWQQATKLEYLQHNIVGVHFYVPTPAVGTTTSAASVSAVSTPLTASASPRLRQPSPRSIREKKPAVLLTASSVANTAGQLQEVASIASQLVNQFSGMAGANAEMVAIADSAATINDQSGLEEIEEEDDEAETNKAGINIEDYLKCFDNLPDAGAQFTIKVMVDIPVDANPNSLINLAQTGLSVGHVFVTISKTVGTQTISQTLGFYPASDYKSVSLSPVTSKLADDGSSATGHEYNASITLDGWNAAEFKAFLNQIRFNARMRYEIDAFNCANFIGSSLNAVRPNSLASVSTTGINPLNPTELINIPWSPNGVYKSLVDLKATNPRLAPKIEVNVIKYCKPSKGPCS